MLKILRSTWDQLTNQNNAHKDEYGRESALYLVASTQTCFNCGKETKVVAFGVPYLWDDTPSFALLPRLENVPRVIMDYLKEEGFAYRTKLSKTTGVKQLNNCCEHCGVLQGEYFLFNEPSAAFFPCYEEDMEKLTFLRIPLRKPVQGNIHWWEPVGEDLLRYVKSNHMPLDLQITETLRA